MLNPENSFSLNILHGQIKNGSPVLWTDGFKFNIFDRMVSNKYTGHQIKSLTQVIQKTLKFDVGNMVFLIPCWSCSLNN